MRNVSLFLMLLLAGLFFIRPAAAELPASVVISEVTWMGSSASASDEWIELYNATLEPVDITGWTLRESDGSPEITLEGHIAADGYFLLERTDDETVPGVRADQIYTGALNNSDRTLTLYDSAGSEIDLASWGSDGPGDNAEDKTMERAADGTWGTSLVVDGTPRVENSIWYTNESEPEPEPATEENPDEPSGGVGEPEPKETTETEEEVIEETTEADAENGEEAPAQNISASFRLSEILPDPEGRDSEDEFVEIYNAGDASASLDGWVIRDARGGTLSLTGTVAAGEYVTFFSKDVSLPSLNNNGDVIELLDPAGTRRDGVEYADAPKGLSLSYFASGWAWTSSLTPGAENILKQPDSSQNTAAPAAVSLAQAPPLGDLGGPGGSSSGSGQNNRAAASGSSFAAALDQTSAVLESLPALPSFSPMLLLVSLGSGVLVFFLRRFLRSRRNPRPDPVFAVEETDDFPMA